MWSEARRRRKVYFLSDAPGLKPFSPFFTHFMRIMRNYEVRLVTLMMTMMMIMVATLMLSNVYDI